MTLDDTFLSNTAGESFLSSNILSNNELEYTISKPKSGILVAAIK